MAKGSGSPSPSASPSPSPLLSMPRLLLIALSSRGCFPRGARLTIRTPGNNSMGGFLNAPVSVSMTSASTASCSSSRCRVSGVGSYLPDKSINSSTFSSIYVLVMAATSEDGSSSRSGSSSGVSSATSRERAATNRGSSTKGVIGNEASSTFDCGKEGMGAVSSNTVGPSPKALAAVPSGA